MYDPSCQPGSNGDSSEITELSSQEPHETATSREKMKTELLIGPKIECFLKRYWSQCWSAGNFGDLHELRPCPMISQQQDLTGLCCVSVDGGQAAHQQKSWGPVF